MRLLGVEEDECGGYSTDAHLGTRDRVLSTGVVRGGHRIREEPQDRDCKGDLGPSPVLAVWPARCSAGSTLSYCRFLGNCKRARFSKNCSAHRKSRGIAQGRLIPVTGRVKERTAGSQGTGLPSDLGDVARLPCIFILLTCEGRVSGSETSPLPAVTFCLTALPHARGFATLLSAKQPGPWSYQLPSSILILWKFRA